MAGLKLAMGVHLGAGGGVSAAFAVEITGLTGGIAQIGTHASVSYTTDPVSATETVKWSNSSNPADAATYGTGAAPTDFAAGDYDSLYLHVTDVGDTISASASIQRALAVNTVAPVASGSTGLGDTLTTTNGTWTGAAGGSYSYQWQRDTVDISGETANTYDIVVADDAAGVRCVVTYTNSGGPVSANSNAVTVDDFTVPVITGSPTIGGTEEVGQTLTATPASVAGDPTPARTWQWVNSVSGDIPGATSITYMLQASDEGDTITVRQIETNAMGVDTATSTATGAIAAAASASITVTDATFGPGAGGNEPTLDVTGTAIGTTANYTLYGATHANGTTLTKTNIENGTGDAADTFSITAATINLLDGDLALSTTLSNGHISIFIRDSTGSPVESDVTQIDSVNIDADVPTFASGAPADGATGVAVDTTFVLTFAENIWGAAIGGEFYLRDVTGASTIETFDVDSTDGSAGGTVAVSGTTVTITPGANLVGGGNAYAIRWNAGAVVDASGNGVAANAGDTLYNIATDATAPTLTSPTDAANGGTASTASVSTNEGNGTLYTVVTTSATAPTAAQVKLGQDNSSVAAAYDVSQAVTTTGVQTITPAPSGLTSEIAYTTHFMHEDLAGNQSTVSSASGFTTADVTAPTPSAVSGTQTGSTTATWAATSNEAGGTMYAACWVSTDADPTAAQVIAGTGGSIVAASTDATPTADANNAGSFTGLTASITYQTGVVHRDAASNDSSLVVSAGTFTTAAASNPFVGYVGAVNDTTTNGSTTLTVDLSGYSTGEKLIVIFGTGNHATDPGGTVDGNALPTATLSRTSGTNKRYYIYEYTLVAGDIGASKDIVMSNTSAGHANLTVYHTTTGSITTGTALQFNYGTDAQTGDVTPVQTTNAIIHFEHGVGTRFDGVTISYSAGGLTKNVHSGSATAGHGGMFSGHVLSAGTSAVTVTWTHSGTGNGAGALFVVE